MLPSNWVSYASYYLTNDCGSVLYLLVSSKISQSMSDTPAGLVSYVRLTAWLKAAKQAIINEVFMVVFESCQNFLFIALLKIVGY